MQYRNNKHEHMSYSTREKLYNNMQGFTVEADGYKESQCWQIKDVSTYNPQAYGPTPFSPRDSQGPCQSAEQGDYKRLIYLYSNPNYD
jgi:hypothetical protein